MLLRHRALALSGVAAFALACWGCASAETVPPSPPRPPGPVIWIGMEELGATRICADLFQEDSMNAWGCMNVRDFRALIDKMGPTD